MSQVPKFLKGGKTIKRGNDTINVNDYINALERNRLHLYLFIEENIGNKKKLTAEEKKLIDEAYRTMIAGYLNGTLSPEVGNITKDSNGVLHNVDGDFDSYGLVLNYFDYALHNLVNPTAEKKSTYDPSKGISVLLNRKLFGGKDSYDENFLLLDNDYNEETNVRGTKERALAILNALPWIEELLKSYDISDSDRANIASDILALRNALIDNKIDENERLALSRLGINPDLYFFTGKSYSKEEEPEEKSEEEDVVKEFLDNLKKLQLDLMREYNSYISLPELENTSLDLNQQAFLLPSGTSIYTAPGNLLLDSFDYKWLNSFLSSFLNWINTHDVYKYDQDFWNKKTSWFGTENVAYTKDANTGKYIKGLNPEWTNGQRLAYILDLYNRNANLFENGQFPRTEDGKYIMYSDKGYSRLYDPNTKKMHNVPTHTLGNNVFFTAYNQFAPLLSYILSNKQGGTLKAQKGLTFNKTESASEINEFAKLQREKERLKASEESKTESSKNQNDRKVDFNNLQNSDYVRLGSITADVVGLVSAWVPGYGTAISAGSGLVSAGGNLTADIMEGASVGDTLKNLGIGLGASLMGLVPGFGSASKTAQIVKGLVRYTPHIIGAITTIGAAPDIIESFKKIGNEDLTVSDWRNIATGLQLFSGANRAAASKVKLSAMKLLGTLNKKPQEYSIKTKDGKEVKVNNDLLLSLLKATTPQEANTILKNITGNDVEIATRKTLFTRKETLPKLPKINDSGNTWNFTNVNPSLWRGGQWSDAALLQKTVNVLTINPYNINWDWVKRFRLPNPYLNKPKPKSTPVKISGLILAPHSDKYNNLLARKVDSNGIAITPERLQRMDIWKKGGIIKALTGANTKYWLDYNIGNDQYNMSTSFLGHLGKNASRSLNTDLKRPETLYDASHSAINSATLEDAYNLQLEYYNSGNIWNDVINARNEFLKTNSNASDEDFRLWYNLLVTNLRDFKKKNFNTLYGSRGWNDFNKDFQTIYSNYTTKFDPNLRDIYGRSTWERFVNAFASPEAFKELREGVVGNTNMYMDDMGLLQIRPTETPLLETPLSETELSTLTEQHNLTELTNPSQIYGAPRVESDSNNKELPYEGPNLEYNPNFLRIGKLLGILKDNKRIFDVKRRSLDPALQDPYNLFSPVVGAYDLRSMAQRMAADMRRRANDPYTSDASLHAAILGDANKQAMEIEYQKGVLPDNQRRLETAQQALKNELASTIERTRVANLNKDRLANYSATRGLLEGDYILKQREAKSNFIDETNQYNYSKAKELQAYRLSLIEQRAAREYQAKIQDAYEAFYRAYQNTNNKNKSLYDIPEYRIYKKIKELAEIDRENYINSRSMPLFGIRYKPYNLKATLKMS